VTASRASEVIAAWHAGEPADAAAYLAEHPDLLQDKSFVLDLAYEEFCLRTEAGEEIDLDSFAARFPDHRLSLLKLLGTHRYLERNPDLLTQRQPARWPEVNEEFLGFELEAELGRGAFARVFRATEPALGGRRVVVKIAYRGGNEARTLGRLVHAGIVPIHSMQEDPETGLTAVCMPYLGRSTLADALTRVQRTPQLPRTARVFLEVARDPLLETGERPPAALAHGDYLDGVHWLAIALADALAYTHAQGVLHRDLKPSNVLLTPVGRAMLLDFNLSADENEADSLFGGTVPYMSPEQLRATGQTGRDRAAGVDHRSDIFSLGVILHELLTGRLPFGSIDPGQSAYVLRSTLLTRQERGAPALRLSLPWGHRALGAVVDRCLAYDPSARYATAAELARDLRRLFNRPDRLFWRWVLQHPRTTPIAAGCLLSIGLAGGLAEGTREPEHVRLERHARGQMERGDFSGAATSLSGAAATSPNPAPLLYAQGRAHQRQGDLTLAASCFAKAFEKEPQPKYQALSGYCLALAGHFDDAAKEMQAALQAGFRNAETLNNLAVCRLQQKKPRQAISALLEAANLAPDSRTIQANLLWAFSLQAVPCRQAPDPQWRSCVARIAASGPLSGTMRLHLAQFYLLEAAGSDDQARPLAIQALEEAVASGRVSQSEVRGLANFDLVKTDTRVKALLERAPTVAVQEWPPLFLDPVAD
jgi:serine/threonine protein kinase